MRTVILLTCLFVASFACAEPQQRRIAITIDDAPRPDGARFSGAERGRLLTKALADAEVEGVIFFVSTGRLQTLGDAGRRRLQNYVDNGHYLANHTHSHNWLHRTEVADYLDDIDRATEILQHYDNVLPLFRFPYLDEGRSLEKRDAVRQGLADRDLTNGYVTVDNYDWFMESLYAEALQQNFEPDMQTLQATYVELLVDAIEHYDRIAVDVIGRSPAHVLLLHENDLAAMFIDDLAAALRAAGWSIIPGPEAYLDSLASEEPDTLFLGQGRIAALARIAGHHPRDLVHVTEDEAALRQIFIDRGLLPGSRKNASAR